MISEFNLSFGIRSLDLDLLSWKQSQLSDAELGENKVKKGMKSSWERNIKECGKKIMLGSKYQEIWGIKSCWEVNINGGRKSRWEGNIKGCGEENHVGK